MGVPADLGPILQHARSRPATYLSQIASTIEKRSCTCLDLAKQQHHVRACSEVRVVAYAGILTGVSPKA